MAKNVRNDANLATATATPGDAPRPAQQHPGPIPPGRRVTDELVLRYMRRRLSFLEQFDRTLLWRELSRGSIFFELKAKGEHAAQRYKWLTRKGVAPDAADRECMDEVIAPPHHKEGVVLIDSAREPDLAQMLEEWKASAEGLQFVPAADDIVK